LNNIYDHSLFFSRCLGLLDLLFDLLGFLAALSLHVLVVTLLLSVFFFGYSLEIIGIVFMVIRVHQLVSRVHLLGLVGQTTIVTLSR
jgi:hypothetical protein